MLHDRIVRDPRIMVGKPTIKGTRITVELIMERIRAGLSEEEIIALYSHLTLEDVRAAVAYAADGKL